MLAATTCLAVGSPAALREKLLLRGRMERMVALSSCAPTATATQSPTAGNSSWPAARCRSLPAAWAINSPSAVSTR